MTSAEDQLPYRVRVDCYTFGEESEIDPYYEAVVACAEGNLSQPDAAERITAILADQALQSKEDIDLHQKNKPYVTYICTFVDKLLLHLLPIYPFDKRRQETAELVCLYEHLAQCFSDLSDPCSSSLWELGLLLFVVDLGYCRSRICRNPIKSPDSFSGWYVDSGLMSYNGEQRALRWKLWRRSAHGVVQQCGLIECRESLCAQDRAGKVSI